MTLVNIDTGEIVSALTFDEATELTESIRQSLGDLQDDVVRAYRGLAHKALDYASWDEYVKGEFGYAPLALPREDRPAQVASLREQGLSLRAIGAVTGADVKTIRSDLEGVGNSHTSPVVGIDGKEYAPRPAPPPLTEADRLALQRESQLRAARTNLASVLIYLTSDSISPKALAKQSYGEIAGEFSIDRLHYAAETIQHIIQIGEGK